MKNTGLEKLGIGEWDFNKSSMNEQDTFSLSRVIEVNKNSYVVSDGNHEILAELSGKLLFEANNCMDYPTVGDWVTIQPLDNFTFAIIHSLLPRKSLLKRKESGKRIDFQLIAANIDIGLIVQSAEHLNFNLLDRYFIMLNESNIQPVVVFSKMDLLSPAEIEIVTEKLSTLKYQYLLISNVTKSGIDELSKCFLPGKTYCLLGQSGVGKTSLLNTLLCTDELKVNEVREKDGRGKHTTVRRQLICHDSGSIFIDTPGMRELGNFEIEHGFDQTFEDFSMYTSQCRFRDCTHTDEEGCAVIAAVNNGEIVESRYKNFLKLKKESEFYEMSYLEKRQKDKSFGKFLKNYKKLKKKR